MSRSNPHENAPNPATRWFEWNGEKGIVRYYDKDAKKNVDVPDFTFILLDELASIRGWHEPSKSGIYSNQVRDTREELLIVKSHKEGILAEGLYKAIKDRVSNLGGHYVASCYVAFKNGDGVLAIGGVQWKGAALKAWMDFRKKHRAEIYKGAIVLTGMEEGKNGRVTYFTPTFGMKALGAESNAKAVDLDKELQAWLDSYFAKAKREQVEHVTDEDVARDEQSFDDIDRPQAAITDDDIPF